MSPSVGWRPPAVRPEPRPWIAPWRGTRYVWGGVTGRPGTTGAFNGGAATRVERFHGVVEAYFFAVFLAMPRLRAMARRENPCSLACCTASQWTCWVGVGVRCKLVPHWLSLAAPALGTLAPDVDFILIRRFQGSQTFTMSLVQVAACGAIGHLLQLRVGRATGVCAPAPRKAAAPPDNPLPLPGTGASAPRRPAPRPPPGDRHSWAALPSSAAAGPAKCIHTGPVACSPRGELWMGSRRCPGS